MCLNKSYSTISQPKTLTDWRRILAKKYKVLLSSKTEFVDYTKTGSERYEPTMQAGEYVVTLIPNPSKKKGDSNWLLFEGTTIGATVEYFKLKCESITKII